MSDTAALKFADEITRSLDNCDRIYVLNSDGTETPIGDDVKELRIPIENSDVPFVNSDNTVGVPYHQLIVNEAMLGLVSNDSSDQLATFFPRNYIFESKMLVNSVSLRLGN